MILIVGFIALNLVVVSLIVRFVQELSPSYRMEARGIERVLIEVTQAYLRLVLGLLIHGAGAVLYVLLVVEAATRALRRFGQVSYATIAREPVREPIAGLPAVHLPVLRFPRIRLPGLPRLGRRRPVLPPDDSPAPEADLADLDLEPVEAAADPDPFAQLFDLIVGNGRAKTILRAALGTDQPVHVLLTGPTVGAKAQLLADVGRLPGAEVYPGWTSGSGGLASLLSAQRPRYLVVEDVDVLSAEDLLALRRLIEGRVESSPGNDLAPLTTVVAGTLDADELAAPLRAGFATVEIQTGTPAEFVALTQALLVEREGLAPDLAQRVAREVLPYSLDPRDAVRVARLAHLADPDRARPDDLPTIVSSLFPERQVRALSSSPGWER